MIPLAELDAIVQDHGMTFEAGDDALATRMYPVDASLIKDAFASHGAIILMGAARWVAGEYAAGRNIPPEVLTQLHDMMQNAQTTIPTVGAKKLASLLSPKSLADPDLIQAQTGVNVRLAS